MSHTPPCSKFPGCGCSKVCKEKMAAAPKLSLATETLQMAISKIGVQEVGGDNRGKDVEMFQRAGNIRPGDPWCAAFTNWCAEQAAKICGVISPLESVPLQGYVQSYYTHFKNQGKIVPATEARPGDLIVLWYPTLKRYGHIGIIERREGNVLCTIEGNTNSAGSREGNCVARKRRNITGNVKVIRWC